VTTKRKYEELERRIKQLEKTEAELNQAKKALFESERDFKAFLEAIPESAILMEPDGKVLATNQTTAMRLKRRLEDIIGFNVYDVLPEAVRTSRRMQVNKVLESGQPLYFEDERLGRALYNGIYPIFNSQKNLSHII